MNFELNDEQLLLCDATRRFAKEQLAPTAAAREAAADIPADIIKALGEQGLLGVNVAAEHGGSEAGVVSYAVAVREIAAADASVAVTMAVTNMVAETLCRFAQPDVMAEHVPKLTSGEYFGGAFGLSEAVAGSDPGAMQTRAEKTDTGWRLNGEKLWITTGDKAGVVIVWARTGEKGTRGLSCFVVPGDTPGMSAGKPEKKMGLKASHTVPLSLVNVELPKAALMGQEGDGFKIAMMALDGGRIGVASQALGIGQAALNASRQYMGERQQFGKKLQDFQALQFKLADMATELEASSLLILRAAWHKERGEKFSTMAAMAKLMASEAANRAVNEALQIFGGYGYIEETPVGRYFRDCRVTKIYEGTSEIQRLVIARSLLQEVS